MTDDNWLGDILPPETVEALARIPLAAARHAFMPRPGRHISPDCNHRNRQLLYHDRDYCPDCGQVVMR
jgi:hypothetical protein